MFLRLFTFTKKKTLCSSFKIKQDNFREKNSWILRFGIRAHVSRASYLIGTDKCWVLAIIKRHLNDISSESSKQEAN